MSGRIGKTPRAERRRILHHVCQAIGVEPSNDEDVVMKNCRAIRDRLAESDHAHSKCEQECSQLHALLAETEAIP